jgi:hypothetical protein
VQLNRNAKVQSIAVDAVAAMPIDMNKSDRASLIEDVVKVIQQREEDAFYPWMELERWSQVRKGMSADQVISVLGEPTLDEPSLHKRKDRVFTWQGRRVTSAQRAEGIVRFYKDEVIEIEPPVIK